MSRREMNSDRTSQALGLTAATAKAMGVLLKAIGWGGSVAVLSTDARARIHDAAIAYAKSCGMASTRRVGQLEDAIRDILAAGDDDPECCALVQAMGRAREVLARKP